ncbi:MAG: hypothetical protein LBD18_00170 [Treponema sp.]|nr:hypothetical protein [Treponema sp.]
MRFSKRQEYTVVLWKPLRARKSEFLRSIDRKNPQFEQAPSALAFSGFLFSQKWQLKPSGF